MKKKRAVIIAINCLGYYSLAIHYLQLYTYRDEYLKNNCKIYTAEYDLNVDGASIVHNLVKLDPDLIAFSCYIWNIERVIQLAGQIKEILPNTKIVLGGQEVTNSSINYLATYYFLDIVVDGEGERPFKNIIHSMVDDEFQSLKLIPGIQYRDKLGIFRNPPLSNDINLDDIPSPYLEGKVNILRQSRLGIMIDHVRGCPKQCGFCFEAMRCKIPKAFSLERIKEELKWAKLNGYDYFHILDPIIGLNKFNEMQTLNCIFKDIFQKEPYRASVEIYAEQINRNNYQFLDCYHIFDIGLQTINPLANTIINRKLILKKFVQGFELINSLRRNTNIYLIYGLPGDNYDEFLKSIYFAEQLKPSAIFLNKLCVLDGTPLRHKATKFQINFEKKPPYKILSNLTYSYSDIIKSQFFARNFMRYYNQ